VVPSGFVILSLAWAASGFFVAGLQRPNLQDAMPELVCIQQVRNSPTRRRAVSRLEEILDPDILPA
jgi:hypothetical protein